LTLPIISAAASFLATLGVAFWLLRTQRDRAAFVAIVAAPLVAGLAFAAAGAFPTSPAAAAATTEPPADAGSMAAAASGAQSADSPTAPTAATGGGVIDGLRREAEDLRRTKRFPEARDAFAKITRLAPFDADAWADLGDAAAAASGGDLKAGLQSIDRALEIDPKHPKALWLKASLELQEKHYSQAADLWQRLLEQLPKDSNDARIVSANLEETRSMAAKQGAGR
jgi:cytochrome c-type biogenesis protein CcmH